MQPRNLAVEGGRELLAQLRRCRGLPQPINPSSSARRPLFAGASLSAASQLATAATGALASLLLARLLGPPGLGTYNLLLSLLLVLLAVGTLGLDFGISYTVARGEWPPRDAFLQTQVAAALFGLVAGGIGLVLYWLGRGTVFSSVNLKEALLTLACLPLAMPTQVGSALALAVDRYELSALVPSLQSGLSLVFIAGLAPLFGLEGALLGFLAAYLVSSAVIFTFGVRAFGLPPNKWLSPMWARCRSAIRFGFGLSLTSALWLVIQRLDLFVLSAFVTSSVLGEYALAFSLTTTQLLLPRALGQVVLPRIANLGVNRRTQQRDVTSKSLRHGVLLVIVAAVGLAALLPLTPVVFGSAFAATVGYAEVLVPGAAAAGLISVMSPILVGHGNAATAARIGLLGLAGAVGLYAAFIPTLGAWGAAAASTIAYCGIAIGYALTLRRLGVAARASDWVPSKDEIRDYAMLSRAVRRRDTLAVAAKPPRGVLPPPPHRRRPTTLTMGGRIPRAEALRGDVRIERLEG